jgi:hypothetical protein
VVAFAPFCNVTVFTPSPSATSPTGFRTLSSTATLQDVINAFNDNFSSNKQTTEATRQLTNNESQIRTTVRQEIGKLRFTQMSIVRKKIKVENPKDKEQWVIDNRVLALVMKDRETGALWTWQDNSAGKGVSAGNEQYESSM